MESLIQRLADAAANLPVLHLALEFFVLNAPIPGDLIDPKMWVEILKVILLQPTTEHEGTLTLKR